MKIERFSGISNSAGNQIDLSYEVYPDAPIGISELYKLQEAALKVTIWRKEDDLEFHIKHDVAYDYNEYSPSLAVSTILSKEGWFKVECTEEQELTTKVNRWIYTYYTDADTINHLRIVIADRGIEGGRLKSQTIYYYQLIPEGTNPSNLPADYKTSVMATTNYDTADILYNWLPRIYRASDKEGRLKRFLEIFGGEFDLIRSYIEGLPNVFDLGHCDYQVLPLYAQWIGWDLSFQPDIQLQRSEIRYAVDLYRRIGTIPGCELMVKRLSGWECRIKEFYKNVFFSNSINSKTVDTLNHQLLQNIHTFEDELHYTYDTGVGEDDWYSFNTVGFFVSLIKPESYASIIDKKKKIINNFSLFLPVNIRGVIIIEELVVRDSYEEHLDLLGRLRDYSTYE